MEANDKIGDQEGTLIVLHTVKVDPNTSYIISVFVHTIQMKISTIIEGGYQNLYYNNTTLGRQRL